VRSQSRIVRIGLQRENREDRQDSEGRLDHLPERFMVDKRSQRCQAEAMLAHGELTLRAEVALKEYVERIGVVGAIDDPSGRSRLVRREHTQAGGVPADGVRL
jgi:hypothetical protein